MSHHVQVACPGCRGAVRLRPEYLGRKVACNLCQHKFRPASSDILTGSLESRPADEQAADGAQPLVSCEPELQAEDLPKRADRRKPDEVRVRELKKERAILAAQLAATNGRLAEKSAQLAELRTMIESQRSDLDEARRRREHAEAQALAAEERRAALDAEAVVRIRERDELLAELDRTRLEAQSLQGRAGEADRLASDLDRAREDLERVWGELTEATRRATPSEPSQQALESLGEEVRSVRPLFEQFREEANTIRSELVAQLTTAQRQLAQGDAELTALRTAHAVLEAECRHKDGEVERYVAHVAELETALRTEVARADAANRELHHALEEARGHREDEQASLLERLDQLRDALLQRTEDHTDADSAGPRFEAETRAWHAMLQEIRDLSGAGHEEVHAAAERLDQEIITLQQERGGLLNLVDSLKQERDRITTYRDQLQASFHESERGLQAKLAQASEVVKQLGHERNLANRRADEMAGQVCELREQLMRLSGERDELNRQLIAQRTITRSAPPLPSDGLAASTGSEPAPRSSTVGTEATRAAGSVQDAAWTVGGDHRDLALVEIGSEFSRTVRSKRSGGSVAE